VLFITLIAWFVNGKSTKPREENIHESV
jgi:PTS system ascorbate-specific IIC component